VEATEVITLLIREYFIIYGRPPLITISTPINKAQKRVPISKALTPKF